jgi:hypothetical protein
VASATFLVDAESNLGKSLGGMGNMPGMEMTTPPTPLPMTAPKAGPKAAPAPTSTRDPMADMPGMDHSSHTVPKPAKPPVPPPSKHDGHRTR